MVQLIIMNSFSFALFSHWKRTIETQFGRSKSWNDNFRFLNAYIAGGITGLMSASISTPFELVKIQMQLENVANQKIDGASPGLSLSLNPM